MPSSKLQCWNDLFRLLPVGQSRGLRDLNAPPERPFDAHLQQAGRAAGPPAGDRTTADSAPRPAAGEDDRREHPARPSQPSEAEPDASTTPSAEPEGTASEQPQRGADADDHAHAEEAAAAEDKPKAKQDQSDGKTDGDEDDRHAAADKGASGPVAAAAPAVARKGEPVPVSPEKKQESSGGQADGHSGNSGPTQQSKKATQPAKLAPGQPLQQKQAKQTAAAEGDASAGAEAKAGQRQADHKAGEAAPSVSKETATAPGQAGGAAELAAVASSREADAASSESAKTGEGRGGKAKAGRPAQSAGPTANRAAAPAAAEPTPATVPGAARQPPAASSEQVLSGVTSPEGGKEKTDTRGTTAPATSGRTVQNETAGQVRTAAGQASARASATPARDVPPGGDVGRARFVQRVARAFQAVGSGGGSVRLRLRPPHLGSLRLELTVRNGAMTARLEVETDAARHALLDNLPALRHRLAQQDIRIERFDVDLTNGQSSGLPRQPGGNPQPGQQPGWNGPPMGNRVSAKTEDVSGPAPVAGAGEGYQLNVIV